MSGGASAAGRCRRGERGSAARSVRALGRTRPAGSPLSGKRWRQRPRQDQRLHRARGTELHEPGLRIELVGAQPSRDLADLESRHRRSARALLPACRGGEEDRRLRSQRTRWRLEHPGAQDPRRTRRRRLEAQRQQALHHQRADRRFPARGGPHRVRTPGRRDQPLHRRAAGQGHAHRQAEERGHPCLRDRPDPYRGCVRAGRLRAGDASGPIP